MEEKHKEEYFNIIKEILGTESNISKSFDVLLNKIILNEFDSIDDYNYKLNLIKDILRYHNERTYLLQKILHDYLNLITFSNEFKDLKINDNTSKDNYINKNNLNKDLEELKIDDDYEIIDRCKVD
ncbi:MULTISPECIES: hypothetical protein [Paraclostridium]|uniref:hypothetical protein n=1 Tax=Paraclostridium TaxID=1849822 RepID=UPI0014764F2A|nr:MULTISPECIES: hypothetical protein [Paraclostridium]MBZ6007514.1 hypothetical protein [Paraclostridium bifermentans]MCU9813037.1 hypothetical protein [Paraclostridium sp. AKS81]MDU0298027.1 hypothetical protein [Paraclostridium sp. MRS3W1]